MGDYLKLFETTSEYESFIQTDYDKPNVSYCEDDKDVHYNPIQYICKLTLRDGSVVNIEGSGILTRAMISGYSATCVSAEIGEVCTSIGGSAFANCTSLSSVTIPKSVISIGNYAFYARPLLSINVDEENTVYDSRNNCNAIIETATNTLLFGCKSTVIPNSVTSIANVAFYECNSLTNITIPSGLTSIGSAAFIFCTGLANITSLSSTAPTITNNSFANVARNGTLYVPIGSTGYNTGWWKQWIEEYNWSIIEQ